MVESDRDSIKYCSSHGSRVPAETRNTTHPNTSQPGKLDAAKTPIWRHVKSYVKFPTPIGQLWSPLLCDTAEIRIAFWSLFNVTWIGRRPMGRLSGGRETGASGNDGGGGGGREKRRRGEKSLSFSPRPLLLRRRFRSPKFPDRPTICPWVSPWVSEDGFIAMAMRTQWTSSRKSLRLQASFSVCTIYVAANYAN